MTKYIIKEVIRTRKNTEIPIDNKNTKSTDSTKFEAPVDI
jgi:hypothetical protein